MKNFAPEEIEARAIEIAKSMSSTTIPGELVSSPFPRMDQVAMASARMIAQLQLTVERLEERYAVDP